MKDMCHHLKHIQKKVLQAVRKDENQSKASSNQIDQNHVKLETEISPKGEKRADSNHRVPRLVVRSAVH